MIKCHDCQEKATRIYKAHTKLEDNIFLCENHSDDNEWRHGHERYAPFRVSEIDCGAMETWEKEWQYLCRWAGEGYIMIHPKAKYYVCKEIL